jgi:hypothetical protein
VRGVFVGLRIHVAADAVDVLRVRFAAHVLGALEHHVLEHVRRAAARALFVFTAGAIPELHRDDGRRCILEHGDLQAVRERERLDRRQLRDALLGGRRGFRRCGYGCLRCRCWLSRGERCRDEDRERSKTSHDFSLQRGGHYQAVEGLPVVTRLEVQRQ